VLAGTVTGVCDDTIRAISYSKARPQDRLRAWVKMLALTAARPERPFQSIVIGRARSGAYRADVTVVRIPALGDDAHGRRVTALEELAALVDLYDRGMREPLPLARETSAAYAFAVAAGRDGVAAANAAWTSTFDRDREDRQPEHRLVYGGEIPLAEVLAGRPRDDEDWHPEEPSRFGVYARRLWESLLAREVIDDR